MKSIGNFLFYFTICFFIFDGPTVYGQSDETSKSQFFDAKYAIIKNSMVHDDTATFKILKNHPVRISKVNADTIFVELKQFGEVDVADNELLKRVKKENNVMYILISEGTDKLKFTDFDLSPLVIPLKIRPALDNNPLQFLGDVAIGPYFGYQKGSKSFNITSQPTQTSTTFCAFGTPTLINLNPSNQSDNAANSNTVLGISTGGGILFDINDLQFGLVGGWDWISGTVSQSWVYQGKPWLSFSFAYNLSNQ